MYRREGGVQYRAEQNSPTESPPDWDLATLDFTSSYATTCLKESLTPVLTKMPLNNIAPTTSVIGSWMEEEIKPLKSVLESLQGLSPAELRSLESLLSDRGSGLNTPPPLPVLADISDCITPVDTFDCNPVTVDNLKKEKGLSTFRGSSGESPLLDPSIENTVNLRDLFGTHDFHVDTALLEDLKLEPLYFVDDLKEPRTENYSPQQLRFDDGLAAEAAVSPVQINRTDSSLFYLPAVCLEEQIEETVEENNQLLLELNNGFDYRSGGRASSPEIITISIDEYGLLSETHENQSYASETPRVARPRQSGAPLVAKQPLQERDTARNKIPKNEKQSSASSRKRRIASLDKDSDEYKDKRARNNESVRKSRDKAKHKQEETEGHLYVLSTENQRLQDRVDSLEKELSVLRGLFTSTSTAPPTL